MMQDRREILTYSERKANIQYNSTNYITLQNKLNNCMEMIYRKLSFISYTELHFGNDYVFTSQLSDITDFRPNMSTECKRE